MAGPDIEAQTEQVLKNVSAILEAAGSSLQHVLRCGVFLTDMSEFQRMNAVYARMFGNHRPGQNDRAGGCAASRGPPRRDRRDCVHSLRHSACLETIVVFVFVFAFVFVLASVMSAPMADAARAPLPPITYTLRFPAPATHYVEVEADVPTSSQPQVDLRMAVWTPGSYLVREYSRNVEAVEAHLPDGSAAVVTKTDKNRWRIDTRGSASVRVSYRVYAREMGVRSNFIDPDFALLNGAPTFLSLVESAARPHEVRIELPAGWSDVKTALPAVPGSARTYRAPDFDTLVDSPMVLGTPAVYGFSVEGVRHELVNVGEAGVWDGPRSARDVEQIVRAETAFWGTVPYPAYYFLNVISEGSGAIEHNASTVLMTSRWRTASRKPYLDWLSTAAHEFFHAWNVKRLRPVELGPFDYDRENYTRSLWIAEGLTDYYGDLFLRRAEPVERSRVSRRALGRDREAADDARTPGPAGRARVVRRVDQAVSSGRQLEQRLGGLLHQGLRHRLSAGR